MDTSARAPGYDLFKLVVAIILLILFLFLVRRQAPQNVIPQPQAETLTPPLTTSAAPTLSSPQGTLTSPTPAESVSSTAFPTGTNTPPPAARPSTTPTPLPSLTITAPIESTATPVAKVPANPGVCDAVTSRARLGTGINATILRRLNFRSSPGIRDNWLLTNIPGTNVEVVGGPECVPYWTGAYLWWQIRLPDGRIGWSAEGSLHGSFYFMEPVE